MYSFISLIPNPPEGFKYITPSKHDLLGGSVSIYADSIEDATSLIDNFTKRVQGVIITPNERFFITSLGSALWHIGAPLAMNSDLANIAAGYLDMFSSGQSALNENEHMKLQLERVEGIQAQLTENYNKNVQQLGEKVTQLRKEMAKSKQAEMDLHNTNERIETILKSIQSGIIVIDVETRLITMANPAALAMISATQGEVVGRICHEFVCPRQQGACPIMDLGESVDNRETLLIKADGSQMDILKTVVPVILEGRKCLLETFVDITERKQAQVEKEKLENQLHQSQKMDAIGQLAGGVAHDFNNMLSGIMGAAQVLKKPKFNIDERGLKFVEMILEASERAADLTGKLLAFGRKGKNIFAPIDIHTIIDDVLAFLNSTIDKKIEISVNKNADKAIVIGDNSALQNSLLNLGINASHAMKNGGMLVIETRNITLSENYCSSSLFDLKPGEFIEIEVRDSGTGISPENVEKIFEPFFTTKKQGEGTGLGLASVYGTIQDHHGAINVYSEVGTGTVFHLYIPCGEEKEEKEQKNEVLLSGVGQILLVDDEELIRVTSEYTLNNMGYEVILAENGLEAVDIFKEKFAEIDLVIMDMIMPEMNGSEASYKMKEIDPNCKIIISSGFTKDENLKELKKDGLLGFIQKPFRDYELSKLLTEIMGGEQK